MMMLRIFKTEVDAEHVKDYMADQVDLSKYEADESFSPVKAMSSPVLIPIMRLQNGSMTTGDCSLVPKRF